MKIHVLRDYSGAEGTDADKNVRAGSTHTVTRARAAELKAVGLVEIVGDDPHPDDEKETEEVSEQKPEGGEKVAQPVTTKVMPTTPNKAAPKVASKPKG